MTSSKVSNEKIQELMILVKIIARRYHHPGHAILDVSGLVGMGDEVITGVVRSVDNGDGSPDLVWLKQALRVRFKRKIIDLRRKYLLKQRRKAVVIQQSALESRPGKEDWEPRIGMFGEEINYHRVAESVVDAEKLLKSIKAKLNDLEYYIFVLHFLEGAQPTEICHDLDIPRGQVTASIRSIQRTLTIETLS